MWVRKEAACWGGLEGKREVGTWGHPDNSLEKLYHPYMFALP